MAHDSPAPRAHPSTCPMREIATRRRRCCQEQGGPFEKTENMMSTIRRYAAVVAVAAAILGVSACTDKTQGSYQDQYYPCPGCTDDPYLDPDGNGRWNPTSLDPGRIRQY